MDQGVRGVMVRMVSFQTSSALHPVQSTLSLKQSNLTRKKRLGRKCEKSPRAKSRVTLAQLRRHQRKRGAMHWLPKTRRTLTADS